MITPIDKAVRSGFNSFELQDVTEGITRSSSVKTGFLQALLGGTMNEFSVTTDKLSYDELVETVQLPVGKRFDEVGGARVSKDNALEKLFRTGSYGISANASPADVSGKRKPFTNEVYTLAERVNEMSRKMERSWVDHNELALASVLNSDTNSVFGGASKSYNFFEDVYGDTRANLGYAATDLLLGGTTAEKIINDLVDKLQQECAKANTTYTALVMLCSGDLYDKLFDYEQTKAMGVMGVNTPLTLDLRSLAGDRGGFSADEMVFQRRHFTSTLTGVTYIRMADSIGGISLMGGTNKGYLLPVGAENTFATVYSPSQTMDHVNTMGMKKYAFMEEHNRRGVTLWEESNNLYMNRNAKLVFPVVSST